MAASMAFFVSCEKAVQPVNEGGYANQVQITVADTLLDTIAFGPFLIFGSILSLVFGQQIFDWYIGLF